MKVQFQFVLCFNRERTRWRAFAPELWREWGKYTKSFALYFGPLNVSLDLLT
jgi:hypothetical protein